MYRLRIFIYFEYNFFNMHPLHIKKTWKNHQYINVRCIVKSLYNI